MSNQETSRKKALFAWQRDAPLHWEACGRKGILKAVPGAGKTVAACEIIRYSGAKDIVVVVPTRALFWQWKAVLYDEGIRNARIMTINKASRALFGKCELLIIDEVHKATSPKFSNVFKVWQRNAILGLTATPNERCTQLCGPVFTDIGYQEAHISDFKVLFHAVPMSPREAFDYQRLTTKMAYVFNLLNRWEGERLMLRRRLELEQALFFLTLRRRALVYNIESRIPYALRLIKKLMDEGLKVMVACERIEQAQKLAEHIPEAAIYHSLNPDEWMPEAFRRGDRKVMISVRSLAEGYDVPDMAALIVLSTTLSPARHVQAIGRATRYFPGKKAQIHVLLGSGSTDFELVELAMNLGYDFEMVNFNITHPGLDSDEQYFVWNVMLKPYRCTCVGRHIRTCVWANLYG